MVIGQVLSEGTNWKMVAFQHYDLSFAVFNVYGPSTMIDKKNLCQQLTNLMLGLGDQNIILGGDFNSIRSLNEKKGGIVPPPKIIEDFVTFIYDNKLADLLSLLMVLLLGTTT